MAEKKKAGGTGLVQTSVKKCECLHPAQDALYGKQMRLHRSKTGNTPTELCTVCSPIRARIRTNMFLKGSGAAVGRMG